MFRSKQSIELHEKGMVSKFTANLAPNNLQESTLTVRQGFLMYLSEINYKGCMFYLQ